MTIQIEQKKSQTPSINNAVLAAAVSALASVANAGHQINIDSKNVDLSLSEDIKKRLSSDQFHALNDSEYDFSVFEDSMTLDEKEVDVEPSLLVAAYTKITRPSGPNLGKEEWIDGSSDCPTHICDGVIDCYDACHSNCHGSRSWR